MTAPDLDCPVCQHADEHGWWGVTGTHCRKCHRSWQALKQAHCTLCCAHFASVRAADMHMNAQGCRPPDEVRTGAGTPRLVLRSTKDGAIWGEPGSRPVSVRATGDRTQGAERREVG
jgi:hypothetical protein